MPFCNIVLLSTSTATGIIMSTFLSIMYLGEKPVWKYDITSTTLIVTGCLVIVFLSSYDDITFTADDIVKLLTRPVTICFLSFFVFSAACTYLFWQWFQKTINKFNGELNTWMESLMLSSGERSHMSSGSCEVDSDTAVSLDGEDQYNNNEVATAINSDEIDPSLSILANNYGLQNRRASSLISSDLLRPAEPVPALHTNNNPTTS